jgi:hypothetical protein
MINWFKEDYMDPRDYDIIIKKDRDASINKLEYIESLKKLYEAYYSMPIEDINTINNLAKRL